MMSGQWKGSQVFCDFSHNINALAGTLQILALPASSSSKYTQNQIQIQKYKDRYTNKKAHNYTITYWCSCWHSAEISIASMFIIQIHKIKYKYKNTMTDKQIRRYTITWILMNTSVDGILQILAFTYFLLGFCNRQNFWGSIREQWSWYFRARVPWYVHFSTAQTCFCAGNPLCRDYTKILNVEICNTSQFTFYVIVMK